MKKLNVKLEFVTPVLGTAPADPEIYSNYIASNAPDAKSLEEEISDASAQEVEEKRMTVFFRDTNGIPYLYDYMIKGFFKNACKAMKQSEGSRTGNLTNYKGKIDNNVFVVERRIPFDYEGDISVLQRPLRAETAQGPRVALSSSECVPEGASLEFSIIVLIDAMVPMVKEWLDYGILNGLCQWHNGGYGRFGWQLISEEELPLAEGVKFMQNKYSYKKIEINELDNSVAVVEEKKARRGRKKSDDAKEEKSESNVATC